VDRLFTSYICRPADRDPLITDEQRLVIRVRIPADEPMTNVRLPNNKNVENFSVMVRKPNGTEIPVREGQVLKLFCCLHYSHNSKWRCE